MSSYSTDYAKRAGQRMRAVRRERGLSLKHVEEASGGRFNSATIGCWERGGRVPTVERLAGYAQWLGVDILLLLPAEKGHGTLLQATAARAARDAVTSVTGLFQSVSLDQARMLLAAALDELPDAS